MAPLKQTRIPAHYKRPVGRPSEYRPEYCDLVIEHMAQGYSLTAFAGLVRVAVDTVYRWIALHSEFSEAVSRARPTRVFWLENKLLHSTKHAQVSAAMFGLRNAAPDEWRDVKYQEHSHTVKAESLTDAQLYAIAARHAVPDGDVIDGECEHVATR
jgi:hypothetical protein